MFHPTAKRHKSCSLEGWSDLLGAVYDAALDDTLWTAAIQRIMDRVGASQSPIFSTTLESENNKL
jgi:hypothetical protein